MQRQAMNMSAVVDMAVSGWDVALEHKCAPVAGACLRECSQSMCQQQAYSVLQQTAVQWLQPVAQAHAVAGVRARCKFAAG